MPKEIIEQKLTKQDVETFLRQVEDSREYEDPRCREEIDKISNQIKAAICFPDDMKNKFRLSRLGKNIDKIAAAIREARERQKGLPERLMQSYRETIDTLKHYGFDQFPADLGLRTQKAIDGLPFPMMETISAFGKPTVIVIPEGDFKLKIDAIRWKYGHDIIRISPSPSHDLWGPPCEKTVISIVDGDRFMPQNPTINVNLTIDGKIEIYKKIYEEKNLRIMDINEAAILVMKSLRDHTPFCQLDDSVNDGTISYYSIRDSKNNPKVHWYYEGHHYDFHIYHFSEDKDIKVRCRPSLPLLTF